MKYKKELTEILNCCAELAGDERNRPCVFFERYQTINHFEKVGDSDRSILMRMYGREPTASALQKIRFWRKGYHLPKNREEALLLAAGLELSEDEKDMFLREYCLMRGVCQKENRVEFFSRLFVEYLCQIDEVRLERLLVMPGMQERCKCHIFYSDALDCVQMDEKIRQLCYRQHMSSKGFYMEFRKYFQEDSVISRETMIRVLILLLIPDLDAEVLSTVLSDLGYAPLDGGRLSDGYVDDAVIRVLQFAADLRCGDRKRDREMIKQVLREYDALAADRIRDLPLRRKLRFMKFRSIGNELSS